MNTKKVLAVAAAVLVGWVLYTKLRLAKNLQFALQGVSFPAGFSNNIEIDFKALNPTTGTATISSIVGNVLVNGQQVAAFNSFDRQVIAPSAVSIIHVTARLSLGLIPAILNLVQNIQQGAQYTIQANINVDGAVIPVTFNGVV